MTGGYTKSMESSCYRCGATLEEGSPFCPSCNAPQIKVNVPQRGSNEPLARRPLPQTPDPAPPATQPPDAFQGGDIEWKKYRRVALPLSLLAGLGIAAVAPVGLLFFVGSVVFAVGRYGRDHQGPLRASHGAKMGAFNGLISFLVAAALSTLLYHAEYHRQIMEMVQKQYGGNPDPRAQQVLHLLSTASGYTFFVILSLVFTLVIFLIVSSFIGAVSVSFAANRNRR